MTFKWPDHDGIRRKKPGEGPYKWPTRSVGSHVDLPAKRQTARVKEDEGLPETVQGKAVGSKNEARVAVALGMLQLPFRYQVSVFGGRQFPGGQVIDFLVFTKPRPTPLYVQSTYWHGPTRKGRDKDELQQAAVRGRKRGWADPKEIWDYQTKTVEQTYLKLLAMFGRH